ncbi:MAG: Trk system potassium transporter TrkA [Faecalibacterium sp.]|nr:Trk system potassium transporter TrkA [Ruminococcus sp.]MCM1392687.1 Trk system potassium transporter TrkA [Ruminococcus sp.]MCM1484820.1 Trk system potassium transporter TrkA [Faecalibacterium sp.]
MNIIIVGCGKVGSALAEQLDAEGHDITVIDTNPDAIRRVTDVADVMGIEGNGLVHMIQEEAGIKYADMFIAMTASDEMNLLCCLIAKKASSCRTIARVRNPDFISERGFIKEKLGISMIINPELEAASEMARLFSIPSAIEVDTFARGRIELLKTKLPEWSPIVGKQIKDALGKLSGKMLICAIERDSQVIIPTGDTYLNAGDKISFVTTHKARSSFFKKAGIDNDHIKSIIIVGGGKITYYLVKKLSDYGFKVKIIEKDRKHCEYLNSIFPSNVVIINGDGSDQRLLHEEGISSADGFASITDIDEENIMLSLYVGSNYKAKTVTKINKLNFEGIIDRLTIGSVIYPKNITAEMIISYVRALENTTGSNVQTLYNIVGGRAQALEFNVRSQSAVVGVPLCNLKLRDNLLLCCISRGGKIIVPSGQDVIQIGDTVVVVTTSKGLNDLKDILA